MEISFQGKIKKVEFPHKIKVKELYRELGLNKEEYLLLKDGKLITYDKYLNPDDKIRIVKVVSGG
jgi:sulfur carrier protein ThiS